MKLFPMLRSTLLACVLVGAGVGTAAAITHAPPPVTHASVSSHRNYAGSHGYGYYHHYYGYYAAWPWYFPWAYGYTSAYYGTTFLADAPVTYVEMAPPGTAADVQPANAWYYCKNPEGYYPYIKTCAAGWQTVPAQPAAPTVTP